MDIKKEHILFNLNSMSQEKSIFLIGRKMIELNFCNINYVNSMIKKCTEMQTYIGNGIAIPHGEDCARKFVMKTGIIIAHFPSGIVYDDKLVNLVIGLASNNNEHIKILQKLAIKLVDKDHVDKLVKMKNIDDFYNMFVENE